ncbi:hypothetical protein AWH69_02435 [Janibacter melonis]|uniref:Uncharacterized protein n=1 Tax=Janibacter melonis TaxID=262209 RepID=A0A176QG75_9MICO|nr:hypothetical protein AWH69_02435 [Janibacter melonis]
MNFSRQRANEALGRADRDDIDIEAKAFAAGSDAGEVALGIRSTSRASQCDVRRVGLSTVAGTDLDQGVDR